MGVTRTGKEQDGASKAAAGEMSDAPVEEGPPAASDAHDVQEHTADTTADTLTATAAPTTRVEPPTNQLLSGSMGDRCTNCGTPLASDQRYCVNCGERRGGGRFGTMATPAAAAATVGPRAEGNRSRPSAATWIAGIATLLIAMGVGVLIGKAGNNTPAKASAPEVITVNGGGSAAGTSSGSTGSSSLGTTQGGSTHSGSASTHHSTGTTTHASRGGATRAKAAAKTSKPTQSAVKKASQAASGVTGGGAGQSNNTVQTGGSCRAGSAGCTNGHFSGNFFGGG